VRVVHFSDWHWQFEKLPEADLYVCTGDMYDNYPHVDNDYRIDVMHERKMQRRSVFELRSVVTGMRDILGSPDAPIIGVRGNHDFIDLAPLFKGCNFVHEFLDNEVVEILGMKVTGHRGIPYINGDWSDEESRSTLVKRACAMVDTKADLYLTHYPPAGVDLDGRDTFHYGLDEVVNAFNYSNAQSARLWMFGHVHECGGRVEGDCGIWYSNAATTFNVLEGSPVKGWVEK
jgi:Icc-related predicted phosphoesterase